MRKPKQNIVLSVRGLSAEKLEDRLNALEARNYFRDRTVETEGLMLFRHYEPQPVRDYEEIMEHIGKISRRYLAWHKRKGLANHATKAQVEYFVRSNHIVFPDGSSLASMDLRMIHANVNLILAERWRDESIFKKKEGGDSVLRETRGPRKSLGR